MADPSYPGTKKLITLEAREREGGDLVATTVEALARIPGEGVVEVEVTETDEDGIYTCEVECPVAGSYKFRARSDDAIVAASEVSWYITESLTDWDDLGST